MLLINNTINKKVLHFDYCSVVWSDATTNCNWLRTGQHGWPLDVHRELILIICMSISLGYFYLWEVLNAPSCLPKLLAQSSDTHSYPTRHATRGIFTFPKSRTDYGRHTVLHRAMATWNSIPHQVTDASSIIRFKKQIKKTPYGTAGTVKQHKHWHRHMHTHKHTHTR